MSGSVAKRKRLFRVTAGNLRQNHLYINGHYDFFPNDCIGASCKSKNSKTNEVEIYLEGLDETVKTDIASNSKTGKPRGFFRGRAWVGRFYRHHKIKVGDVLAMERLGNHRYRLYPFDSKEDRKSDWHIEIEKPLKGNRPTVIELFAGCRVMILTI